MPTSIAFYRDVLGFEVISPVPEGDQRPLVIQIAEAQREVPLARRGSPRDNQEPCRTCRADHG